MHTRPSQSAFSLVELSIVLVILGLLTGGVLAGQSLIRASEIRSISAQAQQYSAAIYSFRDKYFAVPGDFNKATNFWGNAGGNSGDNYTVSCATTSSGGAPTCNGDGNGFLASTGTTSSSTYSYERYRGWHHLANAGLIEGSYTGVAGSGGSLHHVPGTNVPTGKMGGTGWSYVHGNVSAGDADDLANPNSYQVLQLGATSTNNTPNLPILKPEEAWNIDVKTDDGIPGTGTTRSGKYWPTCTLAADQTDITAAYRLDLNSKECIIQFRLR